MSTVDTILVPLLLLAEEERLDTELAGERSQVWQILAMHICFNAHCSHSLQAGALHPEHKPHF